MSLETIRANEKILLDKRVTRFADIEHVLRILLKDEVKPEESVFVLVSLSAHLFDKHFSDECTIIDMLESHVNSVKNRTSTWFDLNKAKQFDAINQRIEDLVHIYNSRKTA